MPTMGLIVVGLVFIAAGQHCVWAGELRNHFKRCGSSSSSSSAACPTVDKGIDVAKLPFASGPLPVNTPDDNNNNSNNDLVENSKIGEASASGRREFVGASPVASSNHHHHQAMVEKNSVPLTSAKEEQAGRGFGYLREQSAPPDGAPLLKDGADAKAAVVGSMVPVKEAVASGNKRITEYDTNVPPYMIIVYHHHQKRSAARLRVADAR